MLRTTYIKRSKVHQARSHVLEHVTALPLLSQVRPSRTPRGRPEERTAFLRQRGGDAEALLPALVLRQHEGVERETCEVGLQPLAVAALQNWATYTYGVRRKQENMFQQ